MFAVTLERLTRPVISGAALVAFLLAFAGPALAADDLQVQEQAFSDWFDKMDAYYEAHPEEQASGFGWKPYNRAKWDYERRMVDGQFYSAQDDLDAVRARDERFGHQRAANTWFALGPENFAGRMLSLDFDPTDANIVYAGGAQGGVWKSTDNGVSWLPKSDDLPNLAMGGLAVSQTTPSVIVVGTGEPIPGVGALSGIGIFRSTDSGETWNTTGHTSDGFHVVRGGPNGTFLAGSDDGLWRSSDDGATWTDVRTGGDYYDVVWKPGDANTVYTVRGNSGAGGSNVKISTDDGLTWAKAGGGTGGQPASGLIGKSRLAMSAADPDYIYALIGTPSTGNTVTGMYLSTDGGTNWTAQNTNAGEFGGQTWYNLLLGCSQSDPTIVIGGGQTLRRSTNSGVSYSNAGSGVHVDFHIMRPEPGNPNNLWLGCDGGLYRSTSNGANGTFAERDFGVVTYQFYDICVNNGPTAYYVMGGTQDNGTDKWSGTTTWANGLGGDGFDCNISSTTGTVVYAESQFGNHRKSTNSGASFGSFSSGLVGSGPWHTPVELDPNNQRHLYTITTGPSALWRNTTAAAAWVQVGTQAANTISISPVNGNHVWIGTGVQVQITTDDGGSWTIANPFGFVTGSISRVESHPSNQDAAFVTFSNGKIGYTTDLGTTWVEKTGDFPTTERIRSFAINPSDENQWFAGTNTAVFMTTDFGSTWTPLGDATMPNALVAELEIQDALQKLVAGTYGRGAYEMDIPSTVSATPEIAVQRARDLMLDPPMPNPVQDRTMLRFAARTEGPVKLAVYDVQGRLVTPLVEYSSGDGVVRNTPWFSDGVPSGVYFVRLESGTQSVTQKIVVTK